MFVVLGASGHTGDVVANTLLARGQHVRVVGRNAEKLKSLAQRGAQIAAADVTDAASLTTAFRDADAAYVLIPPNAGAPDVRAFQDRVSDAITNAIREAGVNHAVVLSSIGADKPFGTGPVIGLHHLEHKLSAIENLNALFLRAGYFMENTLAQAGIIRAMGAVVSPLRGDLKLSMIATHDIGAAAAEALLRRDFHGKQSRELLGQRDLDYNEVTRIIGKAIGKPSLNYVHAPDEQLRPAFQQLGMSPSMVNLLLEMCGALNSEHMRALETRTPENTTPTSFETFVDDYFIRAYGQQVAA